MKTIFIDILGISISILGCIISGFQWFKITPGSLVSKPRLSIYFLLPVVLFSTLIVLSWRLRKNIAIKTQSGSLSNLYQGISDVFYPMPFESPPYLQTNFMDAPNSSYDPNLHPKIIEQRKDGFKLKIPYTITSGRLEWIASGRIQNK